MGSSQSIEVAIIDLREQQQDFAELKGGSFNYHYYSSYEDFLSNQSLKDLKYIVIRQQLQQLSPSTPKKQQEPEQPEELEQHLKESTIMYKREENKKMLAAEFRRSHDNSKRQPLLREILINYIRKYELQNLLIYILVEDSHNFRLPEYEEPYITLIADNVKTIKSHLQKKPEGAEPTLFKFRRMVKDLFRRTVVMVFDEQKNDKCLEQWQKNLGETITLKYDQFDEGDFKEDLISNYYDYIVLSSSKVMTSVQDMKKKQKFQSKVIFLGNIQHYGRGEYSTQTQQKLEEVKSQLWMFCDNIPQVAQAIKNCTDIKPGITELIPTNVVIYTHYSYGKQLQKYFQSELVKLLEQGMKDRDQRESGAEKREKKKKTKSSSITKQNWLGKVKLVTVSEMSQLVNAFNLETFSYLITFDCTTHQIQNVKAHLRRYKYDKRVYMYNAALSDSKSNQIKTTINRTDPKQREELQSFLLKRAEEVAEKAAFRIKFEMSPIDQITTYNLAQNDVAYFRNKLGLMTSQIQTNPKTQKYQRQEDESQPNSDLARYCLACKEGEAMKRLNIINGFCLVLRVGDYASGKWQKIIEADGKFDPQSYLKKVKVIVYDKKEKIEENWDELERDLSLSKIAFVHYNVNKIGQFLQIVSTPSINLTIFIKKSLPTFFKANQKLEETKFDKVELAASILSKGALLKEVFEDQNFKLSQHQNLHFLSFKNNKFSQKKSIQFLHQEFLLRYANLWRTGYPIIQKPTLKQIQSKAGRKSLVETVLEFNKTGLKSLVEDIKSCLYKCKSYSLLDIPDGEFEYFYINRLDQCKTYLDLQITIMYIMSLPHGLSTIFQLIFQDPISTCLVPKNFAALVVALLMCFCSFEDEVINKKRLVVFLNDSSSDLSISEKKRKEKQEKFISNVMSLQIGDVLVNRCFTFASADQGGQEDQDNHCLFFQFDNIPMLSQTQIKNYLHMQPFSFYKENTEYLIAPYTKFKVTNRVKKGKDKWHITLLATKDSSKGFVSKVFASNQIDEEDYFNAILTEAQEHKKLVSSDENEKIQKIKSLYKKVETIGMLEEKKDFVQSIIEGADYKRFVQAINKKKYMQAVAYLKTKENSQKNALQIKDTHFKNMLGVEKAMLYYTLGDYESSIIEMDKVIKYLSDQRVSQEGDWQSRQIENYKDKVSKLYSNRQKYLNKMEKVKKWEITMTTSEGGKGEIQMKGQQMNWEVGYNDDYQKFYIKQIQSQDSDSYLKPQKIDTPEQLYSYSGIPRFGSLFSQFPPHSQYETRTQIQESGKNQKPQNSTLVLDNSRHESDQNSPVRGKPLESQFKTVGQRTKEKKSEKEDSSISHLQNSKVIKIKTESQREESSNLSMLQFFQSNLPIERKPLLEPIQQAALSDPNTIQWQAFYYQNKFVLTQKGKHFKAKMSNKHNL